MIKFTWRVRPIRARCLYPKPKSPEWPLTSWRTYAKQVSAGDLIHGETVRHSRSLPENKKNKQLEHFQFEKEADQAFAQTSSSHRTFLGITTTNAPSATTVQNLVQRLEGNTYGEWFEPSPSSLELTLLFTPSYAQSALSSEIPLQILARLGNGPLPSISMDVVTAVVDRLPSISGNQEGVEGLAYYITTGILPFERETNLMEPSAQKPGFLTFIPAIKGQTWHYSAAVQLPLAQTIFSTTSPSTLVHTCYRFSEAAGQHQVHETRNLEAYTIPILMGATNRTQDYTIPLVPLTPARRVKNSMGNIVRKLSASFIKDEPQTIVLGTPNVEPSIPASQELESAISTYFQELQSQPEPVQVWALIIPSYDDMPQVNSSTAALLNLDERTIRETWKMALEGINADSALSVADIVNNGMPALLAKGGRLCKVLSGGGGWGKKAGLLSFDPDTSYSTRDLRHDRGWEFSFEEDDSPRAMEMQQKQALGEVVKEGEGVMFFLAPRRVPHALDIGIPEKSNGSRITFGALPSSIDEVPASAERMNQATSNTNNRVEHREGMFGMLSEGGMAIKQICHTLQGPQQYAESKLDVPYATLSIASDVENQEEANRTDQHRPSVKRRTSKSVPGNFASTGSHQSSTSNIIRRVTQQYSPSAAQSLPPSQESRHLEDAWTSLQTRTSKSARTTDASKAPRPSLKQESEFISLVEGYMRTK